MKNGTKHNLIALTIIGLLIVGYISINVWFRQSMSSANLYKYTNAETGHEALFIVEGFVDRGWDFCVRPTTHKNPLLVTSLDLDIMSQQRRFIGAEWSRDGQVVAVRLIIDKAPVVETTNSEGVVHVGSDNSKRTHFEGWAYAYNFHSTQPVMPHNDDWPSAQSNIEAIVESHGGFSGNFVSRETMEQECKRIKYWQIPK